MSIEGVIGTGFADRMSGNDVHNVLSGGGGADRLDGRGGNDALTGGAGSDVFVFAKSSGTDIATDFQNGADRLGLRSFGFGSFADVKSHAVETAGGDLKLSFGGDDTFVIHDFSKAAFDAGDVLI